MTSSARNLDSLFRPRSIAIVGASSRTGSPGSRPLEYLLELGYNGTILPINPAHEALHGLRCHPSLAALDVVPDVVLVSVPASAAVAVVEESAQLGVGAAIVFSSGFAEASDEGRRAQTMMTEAARASGMRIVGPNCQGVYFGPSKAALTFTGSLSGGAPTDTGVAYIGQSGAIGGSVLDLARPRGLGLTAWVSVGNQADVTVAEAALDLVRRDEIHVAALYLESVDDGATFMELAETAAHLGKKLVVLRGGRTEIGQRAAASHTGALTPPGAAFDAVAARLGVVIVDDIDELVDAAFVMSRFGSGHGRRTVVLSGSGGAGSLAADHFDDAGIELPELPKELRDELSEVIPDFGSVDNPVDVTAQLFTRDAHQFGRICERLANHSEIDQLGVIVNVLTGEPAEAFATDVVRIAAAAPIPVHLCYLASHETTAAPRAILRDGRVPVYDSLRRLAQAARWAATPPATPRVEPRPLDLPDVEGVVLTEWRATSLLRAAGVAVPRGVLIQDPAEAVSAVREVGGRAVCKVQSADVLHKTELGFVALGVTEDDARLVVSEMLGRAGAVTVDGVLVQEMLPVGLELLVGVTCPLSGLPPLLTVGLGGIVAELIGDVASTSLPVTRQDVENLVLQLRTSALLTGHRGRDPYDLAGAVDAIHAIASLASTLGARLLELEVNPLIVQSNGGGAVAADALVRLR